MRVGSSSPDGERGGFIETAILESNTVGTCAPSRAVVGVGVRACQKACVREVGDLLILVYSRLCSDFELWLEEWGMAYGVVWRPML